ncbi:MAG: A/G-specific adenine glycosylase [Acidobacteriota bacterium]
MTASPPGPAGETFPWSRAVGALLSWFEKNRRDLPWRRERDPYRVWISEVMLQQTRVETVVPYFREFLRRFPTVEALAAATEEEVLRVWEGLGYYARARRLPAAARAVLGRGGFPREGASLRRLPGFGPYTAGAVASLAFGRREPVLDGNVKRLWCRLFAVEEPPTGKTLARLWDLSRRAVAEGPPGPVNEALMELGALVCTPRRPSCPACPLAFACRALALGEPEAYPRRPPRRPLPVVRAAVAILWRGPRFAVAQRPAHGLLGGLWELPGGKVEEGESPREAVLRELREELGAEAEVAGALPEVRHAYSHFRVVLYPFECRLPRGAAPLRPSAPLRWIAPEERGTLPLPAATRKILDARFGPAAARAAESAGSWEGAGGKGGAP